MKKRLLGIMPVYAWGMVALLLSVNGLAYFGTRMFTSGLEHSCIAAPLDRALPFVPFFIVFYILAYVQWIVGFVMIGRGEKDVCLRFFLGELIAKLIAMACFILFPTTMEGLRPSVESLQGGGIWYSLTALIYRMDAPDNLFPSIHCLESWFCFRGALKLKNVPRWYAPAMLVMTLFVFASTVLVKQHVLVDIIGGVAAVEIGLWISGRIPLKKEKLETDLI